MVYIHYKNPKSYNMQSLDNESMYDSFIVMHCYVQVQYICNINRCQLIFDINKIMKLFKNNYYLKSAPDIVREIERLITVFITKMH